MFSIVDYRTPSERGYLAPTVFLKAGAGLPRWNYYASLSDVTKKIMFLTGKGGVDVSPIGAISFTGTAAQTFGINVDFYTLVNGSWIPASYSYFKNSSSWPDTVFRFYTTNGSGAYYAILNSKYFGLSATSVTGESAEKISALDSLYREVALLKYRYNSLASFLNELAKRQLSATEQQIFNEGSLLMQNMRAEISMIKGIEIYFTKSGTIGLPILLLIAIIAVLAGVAGWTVYEIVKEQEKTKRINFSYSLNEWVASKKQEIAAQVTAGQISQANADSIYNSLDSAQSLANKVAAASSKDSPSIFGEIGTIVKLGMIGVGGYLLYDLLKKKRNAG